MNSDRLDCWNEPSTKKTLHVIHCQSSSATASGGPQSRCDHTRSHLATKTNKEKNCYYPGFSSFYKPGIWFSGIMLASGARGPEFDSRNPPWLGRWKLFLFCFAYPQPLVLPAIHWTRQRDVKSMCPSAVILAIENHAHCCFRVQCILVFRVCMWFWFPYRDVSELALPVRLSVSQWGRTICVTS